MRAFPSILIVLFALLTTTSCASHKKVYAAHYETAKLQRDVIAYGKRFLHTPYRYAGNTPKGFDCSGFTSFVYNNFGYALSRSSRAQGEQFPRVSKKHLRVGDLVFFEGRAHNRRVGHVGIVTKIKRDGEFEFIHASSSRGVIVSSSEERYYASRLLYGGRVFGEL